MRRTALSARGLALFAAALRNYAVTLHAALEPRGDIHEAISGSPEPTENLTAATVNPDELAETVWRLYADRKAPKPSSTP